MAIDAIYVDPCLKGKISLDGVVVPKCSVGLEKIVCLINILKVAHENKN